MCVALSALGATVRVRGNKGERAIAFSEFHRLPGKSPEIDTNLRPDELILSIDLPKSPYADHSAYVKARDRASYAFALVSAAAALELDGNTIRSARLSLGGVAHKPWRAESAERLLAGEQMSDAAFREAAEDAVKGAQPYEYNAFKVEMAKQTIIRAFTLAGGRA
jgi:xanthine dehydrogenase YagS FAD-binding subunit